MGQTRYALWMLAGATALFLGMLVFIEIGRRLGVRQFEKRGEASRSPVGVADGAVYGLLALLMGFTFSGAASRYDQRRQLVIDEVDAARTAWQRIAALPGEMQPAIRDRLRGYVDAVVVTHERPPGTEAAERENAAKMSAQGQLWTDAVAACLAPGGEPARMLLLPSLNDLFNVVETERLAQRVHPPKVIWAMLVLTALASSLLAGYGLASGSKRHWIHIVGVSATISLSVYVILELESPRLGLVRVDAIDSALVELRATMDGDEDDAAATMPGLPVSDAVGDQPGNVPMDGR